MIDTNIASTGFYISNNDLSSYVATGALGTVSINSYSVSTKDDHAVLADRIAILEKIIAEEAELRSNHPAVKQAYDEYKLLATLAKVHSNGLTAR